MITFLVTRAIAAVTATLAASSARNMWQTYQMIHTAEEHDTNKIDPPPILFSKDCCVDDAVEEIQKLNRKEFLNLYRGCGSVADLSLVEGDWNGVLLENNGQIMTWISNFMTHQLFSKGPRRWDGKSFGKDNKGTNLFRTYEGGNIEREHRIDYTVEPSFYGSDKDAISVKYKNYQDIFSLWRTMGDEVKILRTDFTDGEVLLGMGCMGWSGGFLNGSPFCLYRKEPLETSLFMTVDDTQQLVPGGRPKAD
mmetsp:Transcript_30604/g.46964  ORF Transcript_30604/g.46964 Transcript_30604/m.46964 type:complete len:251 (+) Transcript_30604:151-903(+)